MTTNLDGIWFPSSLPSDEGTGAFEFERGSGFVTFKLSSELAHLDHIVHECKALLSPLGIHESPSFQIVLRELLNNAVIHGNQNDPEKTVSLHVEHIKGMHFRITIEDQGEGFDPEAVDMTLPGQPRELSTRGYVLIKFLCDELDFNDKGNRISVLLTLNSG